ncbi:unnamed protein product [Paramecium sonneborni]|uniref:WD40-repeat-containing domain n=1 Tax=Paramecium sonneborni TaxID=65129 RepID=A0A8S1PHS1_9CILI|nr:unnamed protein product [Paramecium sonneborni]
MIDPQSEPLFSQKYKLQYSIKQKDYSRALAINKANSMLIVGQENKIAIYQFKQGEIKEIGKVRKHLNSINTLIFINQQNKFISGCCNSKIYLWSNFQCSQQKFIQELKGHFECINCLILNEPFDDLIISGSDDQTIKFWQQSQMNSWVCIQTIKEHFTSVNTLAINPERNLIISCGEDFQILVIEYLNLQNTWYVKQKIHVDQESYRINFINNNLFVFQPKCGPTLYVYENINNGLISEFIKTKEISVHGEYQICRPFFPSIVNRKKNVFINKNGYCLNIISLSQDKQETEEFRLKQVIHFGNQTYGRIFGTLSDDGEYLLIWDYQSKEIQVWIYNQTENEQE